MRQRIRELGIKIGRLPTGEHNAITDVPDVLVGHHTLIEDEPSIVRTGVTVVSPRRNGIWEDYAFAGYHVLNGNGEMTGLPWLDESGLLVSAIGLTNTHQVGIVRDFLVEYAVKAGYIDNFLLPVVAETYDGWLNDINSFPVKRQHVLAALMGLQGGPVAEGNVGSGTGMICHEFKGGIGTSSRIVTIGASQYTVGVLVQANYGLRRDLRVNGVAVGERVSYDDVPAPWPTANTPGSIIVIIGTDAPLLPGQCRRLAQRATVGLARVGGMGHNGSGDLFLAFSTGNHYPAQLKPTIEVQMLPQPYMDFLFMGAIEATEEAILNALCMAETMEGFRGRVAHALPLEAIAGIR